MKRAIKNLNLKSIIILGSVFSAVSIGYFSLPVFNSVSYNNEPVQIPITEEPAKEIPVEAVIHKEQLSESSIEVTHLQTPSQVKAIYMSQCVVGTPSFREKLARLIDTTELNSVVIDIRDYTGKISFTTENPMLKDMVSDACGATDIKKFISSLHEKNIYVIGRITTFQNPYYTKIHPELAVQKKGGGVWKDFKGLAFIDVGAKPYWETVVELGKVAYEKGFDELNFDYIRFPSDGPMNEAVYSWDEGKTKAESLKDFFKYIHDELKPTGVVLSADLFGMTTSNYDDLNIGQILEDTIPYFDFVCPMVYPSHYPPNWSGFKNPAANPYEVVKIAMAKGVERVKAMGEDPLKLRPWLQDFDLGATYDKEKILDQIRATYDVGLNSWTLWDPKNIYTKEALKENE
jgi:hypothetical protein